MPNLNYTSDETVLHKKELFGLKTSENSYFEKATIQKDLVGGKRQGQRLIMFRNKIIYI